MLHVCKESFSRAFSEPHLELIQSQLIPSISDLAETTGTLSLTLLALGFQCETLRAY